MTISMALMVPSPVHVMPPVSEQDDGAGRGDREGDAERREVGRGWLAPGGRPGPELAERPVSPADDDRGDAPDRRGR